jgi:DNA end-binding protein Ku
MKSLWNISLIIGSLILPVKVFGATKKTNPEFEMVDSRDLTKIKFIRCNAETGEIVPNEFIGKAYNEEGQLIPVTEDLIKSCLPGKINHLSFDQFFLSFELPPIYHKNFYILCPDPADANSSKKYSFKQFFT